MNTPVPEYRVPISYSVAESNRKWLVAQGERLRKAHPKNKPHKPSPGHVIDRLVEYARTTNFDPLVNGK